MKNIIHWCKPKKMWSSHTYLACTKAHIILIVGDWHSETKPNRKANPRGFIVSDHTQVIVNPSDEILKQYAKAEKVIYDKYEIRFNIDEGKHLLFDSEGCHLLKERRT